MESLYLLIPVSVALVFAIGAVFWWALRSGQMEDLEGPAYRILADDDRPRPDDAPLPPENGDPATKRAPVDLDQKP
ncbi:MAG: cbb3-type cytochrome oxidase assembly protein CcoS [Sulfuritalea sp.]|nr:cbb3-type cytochrome oxidase assembly protein CcoS [Sulfuritalea sp.]